MCAIALLTIACGNEEAGTMQAQTNVKMNSITISAGGHSFTATLKQNETAAAFAAMLPLTLNMSELNGNEKYYYLDQSLPTNATNPGTIQAGDIMLYGSSCIVIFYETFRTSYSYTPIGHIDNVGNLKAALGTGSVKVSFEASSSTDISQTRTANPSSADRYALNGQPIKGDTPRGIYIENGKKIIK